MKQIALFMLILPLFGHAQSIELDHAIPLLKISENNSAGIELGYFSDGVGSAGYKLDLKNISNDTDGVLLYAGDQQNNSQITMYNELGDPTVSIKGGGYGVGGLGPLGRVITDQLEIKAGSDLAEYFDVTSENIRPGYIASIDPANPGKLTTSKTDYDRKVVGIVSGANGLSTGMFMGQTGSIANGSHPIALTGRAYVYATSENGPIKPGDFLTSSSKLGYAMKVKKLKKAKGAIIGKAMSEIDENGFVLVLINLQ